MRACIGAAARLASFALAASALTAVPAGGQTTDATFGTPDSVFENPSRTPITYLTSYNRDVSSGTWTQSLSYSISRPRVAFSTDGNYTATDQVSTRGLGGSTGGINGQLSFSAAKNWILSVSGRFGMLSSRDFAFEATQRQNRLKVTSQYNVSPWRGMSIRSLLSSEFQQDHSLTLRPGGQELARYITIYNAAHDSVGVDTIYVQRDSTLTTGRQDGLSGQVDWTVKPWLRIVADASGNRVRPTTTSYLGGFPQRGGGGSFEERLERAGGDSPNDNTQYTAKITYTGTHGMQTWLQLNRVSNDVEYFERSLLRQELSSYDQRAGVLHLDQVLFRGAQVSLNGTLNRVLNQYRLRENRNSLLSSKGLRSSFSYTPSPRSRGSLDFALDHNRNSRQQTGNGINISRFAQANAAHRLSSKLSLEAVATASLTSFQYEDSALDQDNARTYVSVGGGYQVSERCSTVVHFSTSRGHSVAIDPSRSANNNVQSTYQMDASLRLGVSPTLSINQLYLLNAVYQIYDVAAAESKNVLSRIRRIDTTITDSLFTFASMQIVHNFLFRDFGSFAMPRAGSERVYRVASETYVQTLSATLNIKPAAGMYFFATQSLSNTKIHFLSGDSRTINNRWNLALGGTLDRTIAGGASVRGTVQHIGAYDERRLPEDPRNELDDWIAGVTFVKEF